MDTIISFIQDVETMLLAIAGSLAVIGVIGVATMFLLSNWPFFANWKQDNPRAFNNIVFGLALLVFAGGGGVALILGF